MNELTVVDSCGKKRKAVEKVCRQCHKPFLIRIDQACRSFYCSCVCAQEGKKNRKKCKCAQCGKKFERAVNKLKAVK
ncbi:hypothetical protein, partial [Staphylococcus aureus]|uniref:hypothetical protein n=1 Tax=Staphylococcus aureus TaxID=1280 RepID=UPI00065B93AB